SRYFVVRDAYSASGMTLIIDNAFAGALGGQAGFQNYVNASGTLKGSKGRNFELVQTFPRQLRVCIRAQELIVNAAGLGGEIDTEIADVPSPPRIQEVRKRGVLEP